MKTYREYGIEAYGCRCELCAYGVVEIHHIGYQEHQEFENILRKLAKQGADLVSVLSAAKQKGYLEWDGHTLSKDDRTINLSVLCPNCHSLIHILDAGLSLLKALPERS